MDIKLLTAGTAATLASVCPIPTEPTPTTPVEKPPCQGEVILHQDWDTPFNCDVNPPQTIVIRIDETQVDFDRCHDAGGQIMNDDEIPAWYCLDLDY